MTVDLVTIEERAAIMEFDGGLPRQEAERRAYIMDYGQVTIDKRQVPVAVQLELL